jgi:2-oxoglutarate ferredoxin oxidoreductase subunit alpha
MDKTSGMIIIDGNAAAALGSMFAGVTVVTWYPITPSSSLVETLIDYMKEHRLGADGKATFAIVQAEDELAAIGMVLGAGWSGARSMTATAGPGISLMSEFAGLGYYVEIPGVIWDIQRVGPSTGLPTRTSQGDIGFVAALSHGDTRHPMLIPCSVGECFSMATDAFNLSEQLQTPVFVMSDLDLGMNNWMSEPFQYPETPINRGKVLSKEDLERLGGFARYKDVDGDGIGYRTLPGTDHPGAAWFARGSGHNEKSQYSERPDDNVNNLDRLARKFEYARTLVPRPELFRNDGNEIGIIAYGTSHHALTEALDQLQGEYGVKADYLRLKAFPFTREMHDFIASHKRVYVVSLPLTSGSTSLTRTATPRCFSSSNSTSRSMKYPSCAASAITTGYPSMRAPSPTKSSLRRVSKWRARRPHSRNQKSTALVFRYSTIAAARPPSVQAADTTPSPSASSTPFTRWASPPSASSRCRASAARQRARLIS